jgi:hypothetical protein
MQGTSEEPYIYNTADCDYIPNVDIPAQASIMLPGIAVAQARHVFHDSGQMPNSPQPPARGARAGFLVSLKHPALSIEINQ